MNKKPNLIIFSHKTGALCWETDATSTKLRNLFLIKMLHRAGALTCLLSSQPINVKSTYTEHKMNFVRLKIERFELAQKKQSISVSFRALLNF